MSRLERFAAHRPLLVFIGLPIAAWCALAAALYGLAWVLDRLS